jgi:hypothetical protein
MSSNKISMMGSSSNTLKKLPLSSINSQSDNEGKTPVKKKPSLNTKKLTS